MNNSEQAKNGFKTFLITFGISLLVFGFFYYLLSDTSIDEVSIENEESQTLGYTKRVADNSQTPQVDVKKTSGNSNEYTVQLPNTLGATDVAEDEEESSPFGKLTKQEVDAQPRTVLAGADVQTTQSTTPVPDTGDFSITLGLLSSVSLIGFFVYILVLNPRKYALSKFEEDVIRDL